MKPAAEKQRSQTSWALRTRMLAARMRTTKIVFTDPGYWWQASNADKSKTNRRYGALIPLENFAFLVRSLTRNLAASHLGGLSALLTFAVPALGRDDGHSTVRPLRYRPELRRLTLRPLVGL